MSSRQCYNSPGPPPRAAAPAGCKQVWDEVGKEVEEAVAFALAGPDPDPATALDAVFADTRAAWSML